MRFQSGSGQGTRSSRARHRAAARLESLEDRRLMSVSIEGLEATPWRADVSTPPTAIAPPSPTKHPLTSIPVLNSRPGAPASVYLDFNGDTTTNWGGYHPGVTPAMDFDGDNKTFSDAELATMREAWQRVSEDYSPFNVNITTVDPGTYLNGKTMRVVVGGSSAWYGTAVAGLSFVGAFSNDQPNTSYVFVNANAGYMADIISHEAGHGFGLGHQERYNADGTLADAYADGDSVSTPIMGGGSGRAVWWKGDSGGKGVIQDDADLIAGAANGFGYRADDYGNTSFLPSALAADGTGGWIGTGVIETLADRDWFSFTIAGGNGRTVVTVNPAEFGPDLDAKVELRNAAGGLLESYDTSSLGESFSVDLPAGDYRVGVMSHGRAGDLGQYTVHVTQPDAPRVQTPFGGTPFSIHTGSSTTIQAEDFDLGGEGVAYHDTDPANTGAVYRKTEGVDLKSTDDAGRGYRLSDTRAGERVEYTVNVETAGQYTLEMRVSNSKAGGSVHVEANATNLTGALAVPNTSSFNRFKTISKTVVLSAGNQILSVFFDKLPSGGDSVAGLNWLRFTALPVATPGGDPSSKPPVTIKSSTSTYARQESMLAGTNYGSEGKLAVKASDVAAARESFLKFDLSAISSVSKATLRLYGNVSGKLTGGVGVAVYGSDTTSWSENSLTWDNMPATTGSTLAAFTVTGTSEKWYEIDLTDYLKAQKAAGKTSITLVLMGIASTSPYAQFHSDDASSNRPELVVSA